MLNVHDDNNKEKSFNNLVCQVLINYSSFKKKLNSMILKNNNIYYIFK